MNKLGWLTKSVFKDKYMKKDIKDILLDNFGMCNWILGWI
jgi:hypothetical protein